MTGTRFASRALLACSLAALGFPGSVAARDTAGAPCPNPTHGCFALGPPGCDDALCCEQTCGLDPFCCVQAWDQLCVAEALDLCLPVGACSPFCTGDLDNDLVVDGADLGLLLAAWASDDLCADLDGSGAVDGADLGTLLAGWGECATSCLGIVSHLETILVGFDQTIGLTLAIDPFGDLRLRAAAALAAARSSCTLAPALSAVFGELGAVDLADPECPSPVNRARAQVKLAIADGERARAKLKTAQIAPFRTTPPEAASLQQQSLAQLAEARSLTEEARLQMVNGAICVDADHDCCTLGGPGCTDLECCKAVCLVDPSCCDASWDLRCVGLAESLCGLECDLCPLECMGVPEPEPCGADSDGGCNQPIVGDSSCCAAQRTPGCDDPACQAAVCAVDGFCCQASWDAICVDQTLELCPRICQLSPPSFAPTGFGQTICGTAWAEAGFRDTDWYRLLGGPAGVATLSLAAQAPMVFGLVDSTDCATAGSLNPFATTRFCGSATLAFCHDGLESWLFVAIERSGGFEGFPCGANNGYQLSLSATGLPCGAGGSCCSGGNMPGCDVPACAACVCAMDPFCCQTAWDAFCAAAALPGGPCAANCPCGG